MVLELQNMQEYCPLIIKLMPF